MGGMIVQQMAIDHPRRVRSMVSIMSTTGNRRSGQPSLKTFGVLLGNPPKTRDQVINRAVKTFKVIGSPGFPFEEDTVREMAARSYDRGHSAAGVSAPAARDHRLRRPDRGAAPGPGPDRRHPRHPRHPGQTLRRPRHREGDPRRAPDDDRRHGPRPAAGPLADLRPGDRHQRRPRRPRRDARPPPERRSPPLDVRPFRSSNRPISSSAFVRWPM